MGKRRRYRQRATDSAPKQGRLREARPRQNCLGLARALAGGFAPLVADRCAAPSAGDMLPSATRISPRFPRRLRTATSFGIMKRVMLKQTQAYKLGVNVMFGAGNQYYHRHEEE